MEQKLETIQKEEEVHLSCAETAKLVRKALKKEFPNQKFSVRSSTYSMGASIDVSWTEGVAKDKVDKIIKQFEGSGFDGMIDYKYYISHWLLPNGETVVARSEGTSDCGGVRSSCNNSKPHPEAKKVSFGADYVFSNREITEETSEKIARQIAKLDGIEFIDMNSYPKAFGNDCRNWWNIVHMLVINEDLTNFKEVVRSGIDCGKWEDFYKVLSSEDKKYEEEVINKLNKVCKLNRFNARKNLGRNKKKYDKEFKIHGRFGWGFKKHNKREFLTLLKLYKCAKCGVEKNAKNVFSYVDGNNIAITRNSPDYCRKCYNEIYGSQNKLYGGIKK